MADRKVVRNNDGLSLQESRFADLVAKGMSQSEAYLDAFNPSDPSNKQSIGVSASRVAKRDRVAKRIDELRVFYGKPLVTSDHDPRLDDMEWLKRETLGVLHKLATSGDSERTRLDSATKLALACGLLSQGPTGTTVNVQQNSAQLSPSGSDAGQLRQQLVGAIKGLLPQSVVVDSDVIDK